MNRWIIAAVAVAIAIYVFISSIFVVNEREQAIVLRFGAIERIIDEPGLYFKAPTTFVETVQIIENRLLRYDLANMRLQVSGGAFYIVDAFLTYRITDPRLFRERSQGELRVAEQRIGTRFDAALRQVYGLREFTAALSEQRPEMMAEARDLIRPDMETLGIDVVDVRILRTDLTPEVSEQTYQRMRAERLAQAAFLRAQGQEAAQSLRAVADRQATEVVAAAQRDSDILRGEGDAERGRIFAGAYSADPEFFEFYRSMQSYQTALGNNSGTTMVLSPDSEFFRYFGEANILGPTAIDAPVTGTSPSSPTQPEAAPTAQPVPSAPAATIAPALPPLAPGVAPQTEPALPASASGSPAALPNGFTAPVGAPVTP